MPRKNRDEEYDWLEDPFNEEKEEADLESARRSQRRSCLVVVIVFIAIIVIAVLIFVGYLFLSV